jgi:prepilin peptidase CpaA
MNLMNTHQAVNSAFVIWTLTLTITILAGWVDWRSRKIPNWLTVSGFAVGVGAHALFGGWRGTLTSLEGAGLALALLLPLVLVRGLGAGDWKLMGAVGALLGPWGLLAFLFVNVLVAGVLAAATVIWTRRVIVTLKNMAILVQGFFVFGWRGNPQMTLDNPGLLKLPFGVAVALTSVICFAISHWAR